ncbi:cytochrome b ascorbate-dependent protein 3 isoform X2 [Tetranychus urticae]|uniref:cytochrome b ascorbate-dependent protein 3 isoform X2 n=1 Tax=Tetranychus urticae TaxID=32264 RepID=UPI00077BE024|nr:cytochrome b ascorbate-dependent protein 3 isoform X2 [Tetranychus urticae]
MLAEVSSPEELETLMPSSSNTQGSMNPANTKLFNIILLLSHSIGSIIILLIILWVNKHLGGFDWSIPAKEFNYHPLFMVLGMVYLYGNSIISYRIFRTLDKPKLKIIHTILHGGCLIFTALGLFAVIDFHNRANIVNFYSLHSWVGIFAASVYALQWIGSFYAFLFPGIPAQYRAFLLPFHVRGGLIIFTISIAACLTGLTEKIFFSVGKENYSSLPPSALYANFIGVLIVLFAIIIGYLVTESNFARKPLPSEGKTSNLSMDSQRPE